MKNHIENLPQAFTSADETKSYDSDDSVNYGEKFTAITARVNKKYLLFFFQIKNTILACP